MAFSPTYWKVLKISDGDKTVYKLLAHWLGGFLDDDNWRLNSGITKVVFNEEFNLYEVYGESGSVYHCLAAAEHVSGYMIGIIEGFRYRGKNTPITIEAINMEDYFNENWNCE